ncbi:phosphate ABC transporter substrate-binding protein PstS family protein [Carnobacteriaceae bacterium zg-ZUI78]|nr:phosphate ABC transporter substrate-binding protein PstS family protein [Carnobacteriaceae bacterium zg-ZUI78]
MRKKAIFLMMICICFVLSGCQTSITSMNGSITAVGSSALQPLVEVAAEQFQMQYPDVLINVQGGGSGQGLSQIVMGTVEIGNSDTFAEEKKIDVDKYELQDHKVAVVGIGVIANKESGVRDITHQQLIDIFTGKIRNWQEVGGQNIPIIVINRASGSGSRATFEKYGLNNQEPIVAQEQDNSGTVKKLVKDTKGAISYVSFSYFSDDYQALSIDGVEPTRENVETNKWKIWAYEHMYTKREKDVITKTFLEYMLSDDVQDNIVSQLGYIPVKTMTIDRDVKGNIRVK